MHITKITTTTKHIGYYNYNNFYIPVVSSKHNLQSSLASQTKILNGKTP